MKMATTLQVEKKNHARFCFDLWNSNQRKECCGTWANFELVYRPVTKKISLLLAACFW